VTSLSGLADTYLSGEFAWDSLVEEYIFKEYDYQLKKYFDVPAKRKVVRIGDKQKKASAFKTVLSTSESGGERTFGL